MPSKPDEVETGEISMTNTNMESSREITQTDHLNKKLLTSYLNSINMSETFRGKTPEEEDDQEEEQNWEN